VTLLGPKTRFRFKVIGATQRRIVMQAVIECGNRAALALKACLGSVRVQNLHYTYRKML
jgi:hypothetical protein